LLSIVTSDLSHNSGCFGKYWSVDELKFTLCSVNFIVSCNPFILRHLQTLLIVIFSYLKWIYSRSLILMYT
jgi:hypothetical protein